MARGARKLLEVCCPCCQALLKVDPETEAVISYKEPEKPRTYQNIDEALERIKGEAARREEAFLRSIEAEKKSKEVLARKFDELFKQATSSPDSKPPTRDIDLD
ncbi:MAG: hypothetical protein RMK57_14630 [Bryobacterales bacterium]|nr:hypothetical protein [Bryobacteraceae bacterium]MDW8355756.1 hypothetical protein [Bryobacterales bacterium]